MNFFTEITHHVPRDRIAVPDCQRTDLNEKVVCVVLSIKVFVGALWVLFDDFLQGFDQ